MFAFLVISDEHNKGRFVIYLCFDDYRQLAYSQMPKVINN